MGPAAITLRVAGPAEVPAMAEVLGACGLRTEDLCAAGRRYRVACAGRAVVGVVGIENAGGPAGLLRSLSLLPAWRCAGLGERLSGRDLEHARAFAGDIYLFSADAGDYYRAHGYAEVPVAAVAAAVGRAPQVVKYEQLGWLPSEIGWRPATT